MADPKYPGQQLGSGAEMETQASGFSGGLFLHCDQTHIPVMSIASTSSEVGTL
jgi:hypothetical protein